MGNVFQNDQTVPDLAKISELAENLVYRLPGCADVTIRKTIREVYREFCRDTKVLTTHQVIRTECGISNYTIPTSYGGVVSEVRSVTLHNGFQLRYGVDYRIVKGSNISIALDRRFVPVDIHHGHPIDRDIARQSNIIHVVAVEIPHMESEKAPRWFIDKHGDAIVYGVLARLYMTQGVSYTDNVRGPQMAGLYEDAKSEARMREEVPVGGNFIDTSQLL